MTTLKISNEVRQSNDMRELCGSSKPSAHDSLDKPLRAYPMILWPSPYQSSQLRLRIFGRSLQIHVATRNIKDNIVAPTTNHHSPLTALFLVEQTKKTILFLSNIKITTKIIEVLVLHRQAGC